MTRVSHHMVFNSISSRSRLVLLLTMLALLLIACGMFNPQYHRNNEVRLAVYEYERQLRGSVDELIVGFERNEPRAKFEGQNENGGRTVWLYDQAAREYFALRSQDVTFLFIQKIEFADNYQQAVVTVYRGQGSDYTGRELTLNRQADDMWVVSNDTLIDEGQPKSTRGQN
jgi:hypothetical protein